MSRRMTRNHVKNETDRIRALSNTDLVQETVEASAGDDWDGCFTPDGAATYSLLKEELKQRLMAVDFVTEKLFDYS